MKKFLLFILLALTAVTAHAGTIDAPNTNNGACNVPCQSLQRFYSGAQVNEFFLVSLAWAGQSNTVSSISDDAGNTYIPLGPQRNVGTVVATQVYYFINKSAGLSTTTATLSGPSVNGWFDGIFIQVAAMTGIDPYNPIDLPTLATTSGTGTSYSITSGTLSYNNEMMWGVFMEDNTASPYTAGGGYTDIGPNEAVSLTMYNNLTGDQNTTQTLTATAHSSANWVGLVIGLRNVPAGGCDGFGYCYIRNGATGSATGVDWTNAYTGIPASLTRGVIYLVAAGNYTGTAAQHNFADADSGTLTITLQAAVNTSTGHGTSTGWLAAYQGQAVFKCGGTCPFLWSFSADYYTINGVYRQKSTPENPYVDWSNAAGYGFKIDNTAHETSGTNAIVTAGTGFNGPTCGSQAACNAAGIFQHDIYIGYVYVAGSNATTDAQVDYGFQFLGGSYDMTLDHDAEVNIAEPNYWRGNHACTTGCNVGGTYFFGSGANNTIESTFTSKNYTSSANHGEYCSCSEGQVNLTIRWNWIQDIVGTGVYASPSPNVFSNGPVAIYGNVWTQDNSANCAVGQGFVAQLGENYNANFYVFNNTIALNGYLDCPATDEDGWGYNSSEAQTWTNVFWENNLVYRADLGPSNGMSLINSCTSCTVTQNTFTSLTWSYQAYFSSANSAANDSDANKEVSSSNPFVASGSFNFSLAADTTAGNNTNSLLAGNGTDMVGVTRGVNGIWDRGALQRTGSTPNAKPPTGNFPMFAYSDYGYLDENYLNLGY